MLLTLFITPIKTFFCLFFIFEFLEKYKHANSSIPLWVEMFSGGYLTFSFVLWNRMIQSRVCLVFFCFVFLFSLSFFSLKVFQPQTWAIRTVCLVPKSTSTLKTLVAELRLSLCHFLLTVLGTIKILAGLNGDYTCRCLAVCGTLSEWPDLSWMNSMYSSWLLKAPRMAVWLH